LLFIYASVAAAAATAAVVGAVDDGDSNEDDPETLVVEKITDAVDISRFHRSW
jgi:hypothetical protein